MLLQKPQGKQTLLSETSAAVVALYMSAYVPPNRTLVRPCCFKVSACYMLDITLEVPILKSFCSEFRSALSKDEGSLLTLESRLLFPGLAPKV